MDDVTKVEEKIPRKIISSLFVLTTSLRLLAQQVNFIIFYFFRNRHLLHQQKIYCILGFVQFPSICICYHIYDLSVWNNKRKTIEYHLWYLTILITREKFVVNQFVNKFVKRHHIERESFRIYKDSWSFIILKIFWNSYLNPSWKKLILMKKKIHKIVLYNKTPLLRSPAESFKSITFFVFLQKI